MSAAASSAALSLATIWAVGPEPAASAALKHDWPRPVRTAAVPAADPDPLPPISLAFYRKHTESLLRRYLYASMQVGRAPSILSDPVARGWASSRPIRTFEDAVIFVLDVERCLDRLSTLDRQILSRVVLQEYTQAEAATLVGMSPGLCPINSHRLSTGLQRSFWPPACWFYRINSRYVVRKQGAVNLFAAPFAWINLRIGSIEVPARRRRYSFPLCWTGRSLRSSNTPAGAAP
jgi:hypothetical protein